MLIKVLLYMKAYLSQCERDERRELMSAGIVDIQRQLIKKVGRYESLFAVVC